MGNYTQRALVTSPLLQVAPSYYTCLLPGLLSTLAYRGVAAHLPNYFPELLEPQAPSQKLPE